MKRDCEVVRVTAPSIGLWNPALCSHQRQMVPSHFCKLDGFGVLEKSPFLLTFLRFNSFKFQNFYLLETIFIHLLNTIYILISLCPTLPFLIFTGFHNTVQLLGSQGSRLWDGEQLVGSLLGVLPATTPVWGREGRKTGWGRGWATMQSQRWSQPIPWRALKLGWLFWVVHICVKGLGLHNSRSTSQLPQEGAWP